MTKPKRFMAGVGIDPSLLILAEILEVETRGNAKVKIKTLVFYLNFLNQTVGQKKKERSTDPPNLVEPVRQFYEQPSGSVNF